MGFFFLAVLKYQQMKTVAAYCLAVLGGNKSPSEDDVKKILNAASANVDAAQVTKVVSELSGKDIYAVIDEGAEKLTSVPTGGSRGGASAQGSAEAPKEEAPAAVEEEEEESDEDMGFGLFD